MNNDNPILFDINQDPKEILPLNGRSFFVHELYSLLRANDYEDLDRIEVYNGALYCRETITEQTPYNRKATEFWYNNAPYLNRPNGITGIALFIPNSMDIYDGMPTLHVEDR